MSRRNSPNTPQSPQSAPAPSNESVDEMIQRVRATTITDRRDYVAEARQKALDHLSSGKIDVELASRMVNEAVNMYLYESEHTIKEYIPYEHEPKPTELREELVLKDEIDDRQEYLAYNVWLGHPLGTFGQEETGQEITVVGLQQYHQLPNPVEFTYQTTERSRLHGRQSKVESIAVPIPIELSMQAYSLINRFWREMGLDMIIEESGLPAERKFNSVDSSDSIDVSGTPEL